MPKKQKKGDDWQVKRDKTGWAPAGLSEHPRSSVHAGEAYVTSLVNAAMQGPDWKSTVIFISWDDWGGFYDHVKPPVVDENGYGIRVPGLMISPYAKRGYIDHQTLSFDAYPAIPNSKPIFLQASGSFP